MEGYDEPAPYLIETHVHQFWFCKFKNKYVVTVSLISLKCQVASRYLSRHHCLAVIIIHLFCKLLYYRNFNGTEKNVFVKA